MDTQQSTETVTLEFYRFENGSDTDSWDDVDAGATYTFQEGDKVVVLPDIRLGLNVHEVESRRDAERLVHQECVDVDELNTSYHIDTREKHHIGPRPANGHGVVQMYLLYRGELVGDRAPAGNGNWSSSEAWDDEPFWHSWFAEAGGWYFECESVGITERMKRYGVEP